MKNKTYKAIGLMSGTSMDGVDVAMIITDGHNIYDIGGFSSYPYDVEFRERISQAIEDYPDYDAELEKDISIVHGLAIDRFLNQFNINREHIDVVGYHGQTLFHDPDNSVTCQIGDGKILQQHSGLNVVNNFRENDVSLGGQGAPLVPIYHKALAEYLQLEMPVAFLNIGGVANITYVSDDILLGFDTGPGNALIDDAMKRLFNKDYDKDGDVAAQGNVNQELLDEWLEDEYFNLKPPKSLDRNHFAFRHPVLDTGSGEARTKLIIPTSLDDIPCQARDDGDADIITTLTAFTSQSIAKSFRHLSEIPTELLVCGGGAHNKTLMRMLRNSLPCKVTSLNTNPDATEAEAFAYLAVRRLENLPITFSSTTGIKKSSAIGGDVYLV